MVSSLTPDWGEYPNVVPPLWVTSMKEPFCSSDHFCPSHAVNKTSTADIAIVIKDFPFIICEISIKLMS